MTEAERQTFAERIKRFRKAYGLSQERLGAAMGTSQWTVWNLENGLFTPHEGTIRRFMQVEEKYRKLEEMEFEGLEGLS
jgi:transcriptional regulator with XRE-family HTH domain